MFLTRRNEQAFNIHSLSMYTFFIRKYLIWKWGSSWWVFQNKTYDELFVFKCNETKYKGLVTFKTEYPVGGFFKGCESFAWKMLRGMKFCGKFVNFRRQFPYFQGFWGLKVSWFRRVTYDYDISKNHGIFLNRQSYFSSEGVCDEPMIRMF